MTDYQQQQADLEGMLQAERKYSEGGQMTGMEVYAEYQVIKSRPLSPSPYAPPSSAIAPINYQKIAKGVGLAASVGVVGYTTVMAVKIAVCAVLLWVEANALVAGSVVVGGCAFVVLLASTKGGSDSSQSSSRSGQSGQTVINNYYQSNSFGGNAEQKNA